MASTMVLFLVQNAFYIFSILLTYKKHKQSIKEIFSYDSGISLKWVKLYILGYILFIFTISLSELIKFSFYNLTVETILIIYLLYSSYYTLKQKEVYSSVIRHEKNKPIKVEDKTQLESTKVKENKYEGSSLKDDAKIQEIKAKLVSLLETEKPYLNPKLSIYDISNNLDINYKYLSQVINQEMHMSFINFINHYRIEASLQLLISKENEQYTIEAISEMAGFNSKSAFNTCFKKQIGETPSQYRKKNIS
jgi:AraC-like DNA-binding protein